MSASSVARSILGRTIDDVIAAEIATMRNSLSSMSSSAPQGEEEEATQESEENLWSKVYKGSITNQHLQEINQELGLIKLCWEDVDLDFVCSTQQPEEYSSNSNKEKLVLWYADNFRKQFHEQFPKRRPLLLACNNECGVQKMVCTTIRPTSVRYAELCHWQGCATFVADHIRYTPLANPTVLPEQLLSPGEVLLRQSGHSFELATLLASLLIGASYDAYVVSGYATREICINDTSRYSCPYLIDEKLAPKAEDTKQPSKYALDPPRDVSSNFLRVMKQREKDQEQAAQDAQERAELKAIQEFEKPPADNLWTYRRHAWVLILPSKEVETPTFLDPASGVAKATDDPEYHGIDSVWNHNNYWVTVGHDRLITCKNLSFDLDDLKVWEHLLLGELAHISRKDPEDESLEGKAEIERLAPRMLKHLDMPMSWVQIIRIPHSDFDRRYVDCRRSIRYRKSIVDLFSPYSDPAGLAVRVSHFTDYECQDLKEVREKYEHRGDLMYYRCVQGNSVHHSFHRGREDALKEHWYTDLGSELPNELRMEFYYQARGDGLSMLTISPTNLLADFQGRRDFLYSLKVLYKEDSSGDGSQKTISKIIELYMRDSSKPVSEDVAILEYDFEEDMVFIRYQYEENNVSAGSRELSFKYMRQTNSYAPSPLSPTPRPLALYTWLHEYKKGMQDSVFNVHQLEKEVRQLLVTRASEMASPKLSISMFDEERNQEARERYKERDRKIREAEERDLSLEVDLLAPYLAALPHVILPLPMDEARQVYGKCLRDWKAILLARATEIQQQFEMLSKEIQEIQEEPDEKETATMLKDRRFRLHCLQVRLDRHKDLAPQRYLALTSCLSSDPRLSNAFS